MLRINTGAINTRSSPCRAISKRSSVPHAGLPTDFCEDSRVKISECKLLLTLILVYLNYERQSETSGADAPLSQL